VRDVLSREFPKVETVETEEEDGWSDGDAGR
jgi:hypothetical protein